MYEYVAEIVWFFPYVGSNIIVLKGDCMEDAVNSFYKKVRGAEIMRLYDNVIN